MARSRAQFGKRGLSAMLFAVPMLTAFGVSSAETLYNGIELPSAWPPRDTVLSADPLPDPPYLVKPPAVIPVDLGRQLFVDDFLVEQTTLTRTFHQADTWPGNPVLKPDQPWEMEGGPTAMPFSDGVWYDPHDQLFKLWYLGGYARSTCYATSRDGVHWEKPSLDVKPGTNVVQAVPRDSGTVWLDLREKDPQRRFKLFIYRYPEGAGALSLYFSPDGIHWSDCVKRSGPCGDRTTVFFNPFRNVWAYSLRGGLGDLGRVRQYWEDTDVLAGADWKAGEPPWWVGADRLDPSRADLKIPCQLYNLDAVAYESVLLGLFSIWRGQPSNRAKPNEVVLGFSRDGFHWYRPCRAAFLPVSEHQGDWNWGNVQSAGGGCLVVGDKLYFYLSGRAGVPGSSASGVSATGLAILRRDGFASMDAGDTEGTLTTHPLRFQGRYLFVNADADEGELRVEVLDEQGRVIAPFSRAHCRPIRADRTLDPVTWRGARSLARLASQPVKLRFYLKRGQLYSFWISPEASGASHGYVAAGGPGFTGPTDTVGRGE